MAQVLGVEGVFPYDGDTPSATRRQARERGLVLLSNPDMLHYGLLPRHPDWAPFLARLRYVVLDELHAYRGVFGTHVALILRRLLRLARHYGASPRSSPQAPPSPTPGSTRKPSRASPLRSSKPRWPGRSGSSSSSSPSPWTGGGAQAEPPPRAAYLARRLAEAGLKGLVFAGARKSAELIARYAAHPLVRPYRAGYTARERRRLEADLKEGRVRVLVSTSALELGVDIGELDAVVLVGYPGSTAAFWQRAGRAGRGERRALLVYIPREDPMDEYFLHRPALLLESPPRRRWRTRKTPSSAPCTSTRRPGKSPCWRRSSSAPRPGPP